MDSLLWQVCPNEYARDLSPYQLSIGKMVQMEVQQIHWSSTTLAKAKVGRKAHVICALAAVQMVLLSIQRGKSRLAVNTLLKSRMKREFQVRFCEEVGVKVPCLTRLCVRLSFLSSEFDKVIFYFYVKVDFCFQCSEHSDNRVNCRTVCTTFKF